MRGSRIGCLAEQTSLGKAGSGHGGGVLVRRRRGRAIGCACAGSLGRFLRPEGGMEAVSCSSCKNVACWVDGMAQSQRDGVQCARTFTPRPFGMWSSDGIRRGLSANALAGRAVCGCSSSGWPEHAREQRKHASGRSRTVTSREYTRHTVAPYNSQPTSATSSTSSTPSALHHISDQSDPRRPNQRRRMSM